MVEYSTAGMGRGDAVRNTSPPGLSDRASPPPWVPGLAMRVSLGAALAPPAASAPRGGALPRPIQLHHLWLCLWVKVGMQMWCLFCAVAALALWAF